MFQLSLIQMQVEGGRPEQNLAHAAQLVKQAAENGAQVVLLPEAMDLGWTHPSARTLAQNIPDGSTLRNLQHLARTHQIYLCSGIIERSGDKVFNAAVLLGPEGELLLHHRKLNELELGHEYYAQGDRLNVVQTPLGTFGLMICADAFARNQIVSRTLGLMGADMILSPSAWAVPAEHDNQVDPYGKLWLDNYSPVARDFRMWIAGCSNVGHLTAGPWKGRRCIGCSLVVGPDGQQVVMGPYGAEAETVLHLPITLQPRPARGDGWERLWDKDTS
jgi:predicted amidohydrolase